jgi:hypothetical protein
VADSRGAAARARDWLRSGDGRLLVALLAVELVAFLVAARLLGANAPGYHDNYALGYTQRVLASTSLRNGYLPLWDHWSNGGAPLANLYTGVGWSPVLIALSLFGVYSPGSFVAEMAIIHLLGTIGTYLWLRPTAGRDGAAVGAVAVSLSTHVICLAPVNFEATVTLAMLPWIALGARRALDGELDGAPILALAGWVLFTTGYLGTNVIGLQFVALYVVVERLALAPRETLRPARLARGAAISLLGAALCAALFAFQLLEMRSYGAPIRPVRLDPFQASARLDSLVSLLFPTAALPATAIPDTGMRGALYVGWIPLLLLGPALHGRGRSARAWLLVGFAAVAFCATLSGTWWVGRFLTRAIPFYDRLRFHGWNEGLTVLFLAAAAAHGLAPLAASRVGAPLRGLGGRLLAFAVVAELLAVSALYGFVPRTAETAPSAEVVALNERSKTRGFPAPSNERLAGAPDFNGHYFTKVPAVAAYQPNRHPATVRLAVLGLDERLLARILYAADPKGEPSGAPAAVEFLEFAPTVVRAEVSLAEDAADFTWSSPWAPAWRLRIDGREQPTRANHYGLTDFPLTRGRHLVELRYRPDHERLSIALALGGVAATLALLALCGVRRFARARGA